MRFLHTSDWHLGRGIGGHDLAAAQEAAVNAIIDVAIERAVDAFVIAGDVFDRAYASVEDVRLLNKALSRIHAAGIPVIATSGNHDEGARLAAFRNLLDGSVVVVGEYDQVGTAVEFEDDHGPVVFYPLPYLDPDGARRALAPSPDELLGRSHNAVMSEAMRRVRDDLRARRALHPNTRAVVVSHAFVVTGGETAEQLAAEQSDSENDIAVGGVPSIPAAVYADVHYVAMGHLHGPRQVGAGQLPLVRYSGSLLRYSVSEANHAKSVCIVDIDGDGACTIELVPVPQPRGMARLVDSVEALCSGKYAQHKDDFVDIRVTDERMPDNLHYLLGMHFNFILGAKPVERVLPMIDASGDGVSEGPRVTQLDTLRNFMLDATGKEPTESMVAILTDVLERAKQRVGA